MTVSKESASSLTPAGRAYLAAVITCGLAAIALSVFRLHVEPLGYQWFMLAALTFISGSATVTLPSVPASISVSETFVFAAVLLFGSAAGTVMVALDGLVISFWMAKRRPEWYRALFNMAAPALSIWCAAHLLFLVAGIQPLIHQAATINTLLVPLIIFALVYFGLNSWLIAFAVALETRMRPYRVWRENFLWLSLNYFSGASVALLLVVYTRDVDLRFIGVIVPLLLVLYATYKNSMDRVEDANRHLKELNRLHLSTIETLAMAIDAKDQITHGHIRRVQSLAVGLAKRVGVADDQLIKAIEAAALLHDMGKLAVPEYILNKPGKLTPAEFEKMKLHAAVGADILSAIDFPYPVVPIVRHHHENWDGSGYPAGLRSTDIPIGARILSVVDCFDALTSDRPYRPRLADEEAIRILIQRRGTMYDPLIVDKFVDAHRDLTPLTAPSKIASQTLTEITNSVPVADRPSGLEEIGASSDEMLTLYELARALNGQASIGDTGDLIARHLRRLIPAALCVFYVHDPSTDELDARHAVGDGAWIVRGLRIPLGQRLSGWVAANRQTIVNSDPTLDLGDAGRALSPRLRSCLSTPLLLGDDLVGVLTLYSAASEAFSDDHRRVIEAVAVQIAHTVKGASAVDTPSHRDVLAGLPSVNQLEQLLAVSGEQPVSRLGNITLILVDVVALNKVNSQFGRAGGDEVLRHVARNIKSCLRVGDILFRYGGDEFVALLDATDLDSAAPVADRIRISTEQQPVVLNTGERILIRVSVACVCAPGDGSTLTALLGVAATRIASSGSGEARPTVH